MSELTSTRLNSMIDPSLHIWGMDVALYLFLGGMTAGIMVLSGMYYFVKGLNHPTPAFIRNSMLASPILLSIGMLALFMDLEAKWHVFWLYLSFQPTSPMSWGSWILLLVYPVSVVMIVLANRDRWWVNWYPPAERLVEPWWRAIAVGNIVIGALLGLYTGILLSGFTARPFWNNGILAPVFLVSGVSAGAAFMILFHDGSSVQEKADLGLIKLGLIGSELVALLLFFSSMATSAGNQREAIFSLLGGPYTATFWVFVVGVGLLVPLLLQTLEVLHLLESRFVMPVMVLVGGLALRILMINAGQASSVSRIVEVVQ